ncbi:hypothetical protein [Parachitinimonas caeni]|uniref:Uncharacterized protein n=1 Tax=Parachitinimonas caeni TaxID=3031301 RepID=A0ABT7E4B3_9NEIS|nr:hypothetical protein [Parachitinimonas caeni]MDK2126265.1 hypothetical protein [Parachitinimonas caeni]
MSRLQQWLCRRLQLSAADIQHLQELLATRAALPSADREQQALPRELTELSRKTLAWTLLTVAEDQPRYLISGLLAMASLPVLGLLASVIWWRASHA